MSGIIEAGIDGSFEAEEATAEAERIEVAKQELVDEATPADDQELIMGKYGSQEEMISAFKSLQSEYSKLKGGVKEPVSESEPEPAEPEAQLEETPEQGEPEITPEQAAQIKEALFKQTGGQQKYQAIATWAAKNLPDSAIFGFNEALQSGDADRAVNAVKSLQYDYMTATGYEPKLAGGRAAAASGPTGFTSEAQAVAAMNDVRYQQGPMQDPAYVREVEQRIAASSLFS